MGTDTYKWHIHCPVCGAYVAKSSQSELEVDCKKCKSTLEIYVKDSIVSVRPLDVRDAQLKSRLQQYAERTVIIK